MDAERSLQELFYDVRAGYEGVGARSWHEAVALCRELSAAVDNAQLFSPNEAAEEISTADLKFLLLPYYLASLLTRCDASDPQTKTPYLNAARELYDAFLTRLWDFQLCGETAQRLFRDEAGLKRRRVNGMVSRDEKIARFKRERSVREQIDQLRSVAAEEEHERAVWCLELEIAFLKGLSERDLVLQELDVLNYAAKRDPIETTGATVARDHVSTVVQNFARSLQKRAELKNAVFRPSHQLPTLTVEQFAEIEIQRAQRAQSATAASESITPESEDTEVYKARAWDDWKDDHPRGYGNSKLKPCS